MSEEKLKTIKSLLLDELGEISYEKRNNILETINQSVLDNQLIFLRKLEKRSIRFAYLWGLFAIVYLVLSLWINDQSNTLRIFQTVLLIFSFACALGWGFDYSNLKKRKLIFNILKEI